MNFEQQLLQEFETLKSTPVFVRMSQTVEGSPWHREANVLVHTEMVVQEYCDIINDGIAPDDVHGFTPGDYWRRQDYLGGIAAVFHDTGKPAAKIEKHSEERGTYFAFHGHELLSARLFETYAVKSGNFTAAEIYYVCMIIEHHMPWDVKDEDKRRNLALTAKHIGSNTFVDHLLADQFGRIADDQVTKNKRAVDWAEEFKALVRQTPIPDQIDDDGRPVMYMPCAPSGAGKSTYFKDTLSGSDINVYSLDLLRHEFYHPTDYRLAYEGSVADKSFEARAKARFHAMIKQRKSIYIDNTNLSAKRRKFYLDIARKQGYKTVGVVMPVDLDTVIARQETRSDKNVPKSAVIQQYNSLQLPMFGEFDQIYISGHNLYKSK